MKVHPFQIELTADDCLEKIKFGIIVKKKEFMDDFFNSYVTTGMEHPSQASPDLCIFACEQLRYVKVWVYIQFGPTRG